VVETRADGEVNVTERARRGGTRTSKSGLPGYI